MLTRELHTKFIYSDMTTLHSPRRQSVKHVFYFPEGFMFQYAWLKIEMVYDIMVWSLGSSFLFLQNNQQDCVIKKNN